jgi:rhomboid family GlyGly-CTERM serine protease
MARARLLWTIAILVPVLLFVCPGASGALEFDRDAVSGGEVWRLATCHWPHWSTDLLAYSDGAYALLLMACWLEAPRRAGACGVASTVSVGLAVWLLTPLRTYRGLSGIDSALFVMLGVALFRDGVVGRRWVAGLVVCFALKLAFEFGTGRAVFVAVDGMVPVPVAHLVGAATGAVVAGWPGRSGSSRVASGGPLVGRSGLTTEASCAG